MITGVVLASAFPAIVVYAQELMPGKVGMVSGLALSFIVLRVLRSELYGVRDYDPLTLAVISIFIALIAAVASFLPTLRITRIDPAVTLRME